jgi:hypothetical protein
MSVSKTNFSDPRVLGSARDDLNSLLPQIPPPTSKRSTGESPSKFSIDTPQCSSGTTSTDSQAAKRVADANTSTTSILKPSMVPGIPITTTKQPLPMGGRQEPSPRDVSPPLSAGIIPTALHYPSSYPVLNSYPIPPNLPLGFRQPSTDILQSTSITNMGDEPPAKRRRIREGSDSTTILSSEQTAEVLIWHERRLEPDENLSHFRDYPDLDFLDRSNEGEELSVERRLDRKNEDGEAFLDSIFNDDSSAGELISSHGPSPEDSRGAKRIADVNTSPISILKPSMITGLPITAPKQLLPIGIRQEPLPRDVSFPLSAEIIPKTQHCPSSYPALKNHPISPNLLFGNRQPATNNRQLLTLPNIRDERQARSRKLGEETNSTTINSSGQTAELPIWHESRLVPNEDPTPYMEFLGLTDIKGRKFVDKIFTRRGFHILVKEPEDSEVMLVAEGHVAFLKKLFTDFSKALEKRKLETTTISDDQLGKLVVSSFLLTIQISMYLRREKKYLLPKVFYLVLNFINQNHCVAPYVESGINIGNTICHHLVGGKFKLQLMMWCAGQGISLNQEELKYLSTETFRAQLSSGTALLKELRDRVKEAAETSS